MNHILPNNKISTLKEFALQRIGEVYDAREARNVVNELFRHYLNFSAADLVVKANAIAVEDEAASDLRRKTRKPIGYRSYCLDNFIRFF